MMSAPSTKTEPSPKTSRQSLSIRHTFLGGKGEGKSPHSPKTGERGKITKEGLKPVITFTTSRHAVSFTNS
ncbi:unnamed protein product [Oncorhynchus mykiss]|uniref:Uncharacterized protein n=1 Tax=Oncorhynchus mykiss TaxID=8022 RepID=A0A060XV91_ONCMY|nr:unnamed protein product [Oncorhynchus mykiss]